MSDIVIPGFSMENPENLGFKVHNLESNSTKEVTLIFMYLPSNELFILPYYLTVVIFSNFQLLICANKCFDLI